MHVQVLEFLCLSRVSDVWMSATTPTRIAMRTSASVDPAIDLQHPPAVSISPLLLVNKSSCKVMVLVQMRWDPYLTTTTLLINSNALFS